MTIAKVKPVYRIYVPEGEPKVHASKGLAFAKAAAAAKLAGQAVEVGCEAAVDGTWKERDRWRFTPDGDVVALRTNFGPLD